MCGRGGGRGSIREGGIKGGEGGGGKGRGSGGIGGSGKEGVKEGKKTKNPNRETLENEGAKWKEYTHDREGTGDSFCGLCSGLQAFMSLWLHLIPVV